MQSSENAIRQSNEIIKKVTLGLLGVFSLFLILFTVNKGLVTGDVGLSGLKAGRGTITPAVPVTTPVSTSRGSYEDRVKSHRAVVARLTPSNIHTNRGDAPCSESQFNERRPSCTSLAYLPEEAIQMILKINADCRCTVVITGGTEPGHTTHGEGKRAFDLRLGGARGDPNNTDPLYVFIKGRAINKLGASGNCFERYLWNTFTFCDEKPPSNPPPTWAPHFHVY